MNGSIDHSKFKLNEKHHYPVESGFLKAAVLNYDRVLDERCRSLHIDSAGKSHFKELFSAEEPVCAAKRTREVKISAEIELRGKRPLPIPARKPDRIEGVRKIEIPQTSDSYDLLMPIKRKSENKPTSVEYNMEVTMNRKQRVTGEQQRNHITAAHPGDKSYKAADREPGFYAKGGLITGSSIIARQPTGIGVSKRTEGNASAVATKPLSNHKTFMEKSQRQARDKDIDQVLSLTNGAFRLGQTVPSWEEKSGYFLCNPEDEND